MSKSAKRDELSTKVTYLIRPKKFLPYQKLSIRSLRRTNWKIMDTRKLKAAFTKRKFNESLKLMTSSKLKKFCLRESAKASRNILSSGKVIRKIQFVDWRVRPDDEYLSRFIPSLSSLTTWKVMTSDLRKFI